MSNPEGLSGPITERISRGIIRALRTQFGSCHEALCELVDNALNYRGQHGVDIRVDIADDFIAIENIGGRGMGLREIQDFLIWGGGESHDSSEISCYNQGGKAAIAYLGDSYVLLAKRAGSTEWRRLDDRGFGSRTESKDYGQLEPLDLSEIPTHLHHVSPDEGAVRIEITDLDRTRRIVPEALLRSLADTYARLLSSGDLRLWLNGFEVKPSEPVLDEGVERAEIEFQEGSVTVRGWCGKLCRSSVAKQPRPGFRLFAKGRLIREGEWLGANGYAKGSLASFYGELELTGVTPNLNKTDLSERGTHLWERLCQSVLDQAQPVLSQLRGSGDPARVTDRDRRLARQVRRELEAALQDLLGSRTQTITETVFKRKTITSGPGETRVAGAPGGRRVGGPGRILERDVVEETTRTVEIPALPEIRIDSWEGSARAETRHEGPVPIIYVNKSHPGFAAASAKYFIAESAILEALRAGKSHGWDIDAFCDNADEALATWARGNSAEEV